MSTLPAPTPYRPRKVGGTPIGILAIVLFFTGPLAASLGFVSHQQAKRSGGSGTLGAIGFTLGILVSLAMALYIFTGVADIWDRLA